MGASLARGPTGAKERRRGGVRESLRREEAPQPVEHLLERNPDDQLDLCLRGEGFGDPGEERRRHRGGARGDRFRQEERQGRLAAEPPVEGDSGIEAAHSSLASLPGLPGLNREAALALLLAKAVSPSPATVPAALLAEVAAALSPEAQIELVVWVSIQQMLHRLGCFLDA